MENKNLAPPGDLAGVQRANWVAAPRPQTTDCVINGFYAVGPADGPPAAYVFGREEAGLIAAAPELLEALRLLVSWTDALESKGASHRPNDAFMAPIRAAIAEATGADQ